MPQKAANKTKNGVYVYGWIGSITSVGVNVRASAYISKTPITNLSWQVKTSYTLGDLE